MNANVEWNDVARDQTHEAPRWRRWPDRMETIYVRKPLQAWQELNGNDAQAQDACANEMTYELPWRKSRECQKKSKCDRCESQMHGCFRVAGECGHSECDSSQNDPRS